MNVTTENIKEWTAWEGHTPMGRATLAIWRRGDEMFQQANRMEQQVLAQIKMTRARAVALRKMALCIGQRTQHLKGFGLDALAADFEQAMSKEMQGVSDQEELFRLQAAMKECLEALENIPHNGEIPSAEN